MTDAPEPSTTWRKVRTNVWYIITTRTLATLTVYAAGVVTGLVWAF